jgi:hypothetical protein
MEEEKKRKRSIGDDHDLAKTESPRSKKVCRLVCEDAVGAAQSVESTSKLQICRRLLILNGPYFMRFYGGNGKRILILGECHAQQLWSDDVRAQDVHSWLAEMAAFAPECLDIMLERTILRAENIFPIPRSATDEEEEVPMDHNNFMSLKNLSKLHGVASALTATINLFAPCKHQSRLNCFGKSVRYHNTDLRSMGQIKVPRIVRGDIGYGMMFNVWCAHLASQTERSTKNVNLWPENVPFGHMFIFNTHDSNVRRCFAGSLRFVAGYANESFEDDYREFIGLVINQICSYDNSIDEKHMSVEDHVSFVKHVTLAKFKKSIRKIDPDVVERIVNLLVEHEMMEVSNFLFGYDLWTRLDSFMVDCYSSYRMFAKYDISGKKRGPKGCQQIDHANNIIWYGGAMHAIHISRMLEGFGGFKVDSDHSQGSMNPMEIPREEQGGPNAGFHRAHVEFDEPFDFWGN